jgi:hypothetical protein
VAIIGRFHFFTREPLVDVKVRLRGSTREPTVAFVVDTGAHRTALSARDADQLGLTLSQMRRSPLQALGVGGVASAFEVDAALLFRDESGDQLGYNLRLLVLPAIPQFPDAPSLLGRDIISRGRLICDERSHLLLLDMHDRDFG